MWTPNKHNLQEHAKAQRMCVTEQKERTSKQPSNPLVLELSESQLEQTRLKEGRYADGTASLFDTCKAPKNKPAVHCEEITYRNNGKIYNFPVYRDNEIGFQAISNRIIATVSL